MEQIWKDIIGSKGYQVSNLGEVRSLGRYVNGRISGYSMLIKGRILKKNVTVHGYALAHISIDGKVRAYPIHRLVAQAFIPNPENKPQVNHINGIKLDNSVKNLEWCTCKENHKHAKENGLIGVGPRGEKQGRSKLTTNDVIEIRCSKERNFILAKKFKVSDATICDVKSRKSWDHI